MSVLNKQTQERVIACARKGLSITFLVAMLPLWASETTPPTRSEQLIAKALRLDGRVAVGEKKYFEHCARCHYESAAGDPENLVPKLAGQRKGYLIKQLAHFLEGEREGEEMHSVVLQPLVGDSQTWADVSTYLSRLPVAAKAETGNGSSVQLGAGIYQKDCASCHGKDARGRDDGFVPSLRNQHYSYLIWQMRSVAGARRVHVHPEMVKVLAGLQENEIDAVADYLSRVQ